MSAIRNLRLMLKICELYYFQEKSQKEIASHLGISRPQVSRILALARETGTVTIQLNNPYGDEAKMEKKLMDRFGLKDALLVNAAGATDEERLSKFCLEAAPYLDSYISNGIRLGVMSGKTIAGLIDKLLPSMKRVAEIIPLVGGIGSEQLDMHANTCAQRISRIYNGTALSLNSPAIMSSLEAAAMMRKEPNIQYVLEKGQQCDIALVGIGTVQKTSTTAQAGGLTKADIAYLASQGAKASVCSSFLNQEGRETAKELADRSIGQKIHQLGGARVIACAIGNSKVQAIFAALQSGCLDILMTTTQTASEILALP